MEISPSQLEKYQTAFSITSRMSQNLHQSERGDILDTFLKSVNSERIGTKFKPMAIRTLAIKLGHIPTKDLYYLESICKDAKNRGGSYSKVLFGSIKKK